MNKTGDRLQTDAEEVSRSLDIFLRQRAEVGDAQKQALLQYNMEMVAIGDVEELDEQNLKYKKIVIYN
jgi:hypothetical protein